MVVSAARPLPLGATNMAGWLFLTGNLLFSGSIYALTLHPDIFRPFGIVTPVGGLSLIAGWLALAFRK